MSPLLDLHLSLFTLVFLLNGCSASESPAKQTHELGQQYEAQKGTHIERRDLDAIRAHGTLRILLLNERNDSTYLPRAGSPLDFELSHAVAFARHLGVEPVMVFVDRFAEFIPALQEGRGDLIAANLTVTKSRKEQIAFTVPLRHVRQMIITRKDDAALREEKQLSGRTISVRESSAFWETALTLQKRYPELKVKPLAEDFSKDEKLDMVANGRIDLTIHDSNAFELARTYHDDLRAAFAVTDEQPVAWGIRKDSKQLKRALDHYLNKEQLRRITRTLHTEDLSGIKKRKTLRVVTRNNAATYFLWRGELLGFEYELAREFAEKLGLRLEVLVAPNRDEILPMLVAGKADVAAAFLTPTEHRRAMGVAFSRPYSYASEIVVSRASDQVLNSLQDLAGRTFHVRPSSSYWQTLWLLKEQGLAIGMQPAPPDEETEAIIAKVADGTYDLTLADSNILDIELTWRDDIRAAFPLGEPIAHGWAVRAADKELLKAVNAFFKKAYRGLFYNITYGKYFSSPKTVRGHRRARLKGSQPGQLSPYDDLIRKYAEEYGFDWRLLVSQMYQESRFDPAATSWAGARGLMQVLPRTAKHIGIGGDLSDPETGIHAGVKYLDWVRARFERELSVKDRMWLSLAGYNAGIGHVHDARRLARQKGWDPNRWLNNVEKAMLLLAKPKYAEKARHGFVRGSEPVKYVRQIRQRYHAYTQLTGANRSSKISRLSLPTEPSPPPEFCRPHILKPG